MTNVIGYEEQAYCRANLKYRLLVCNTLNMYLRRMCKLNDLSKHITRPQNLLTIQYIMVCASFICLISILCSLTSFLFLERLLPSNNFFLLFQVLGTILVGRPKAMNLFTQPKQLYLRLKFSHHCSVSQAYLHTFITLLVTTMIPSNKLILPTKY